MSSVTSMFNPRNAKECRYIEGNLNNKNVRVKVIHLHQGNSTNKERHNKPYMTVARLIDRNNKEVLGQGVAYCSHKDSPRRSVGRAVALGRAMKEAVTINCVDGSHLFKG